MAPGTSRKRTLIAWGIWVLACAPTGAKYMPLLNTGRPPRPPGTVQVMTLRPAQPFVEAGLIEARGDGFQQTVWFAKVEAAKYGCDAILLGGEAIRAGGGFTQETNEIRASCLVFTAPTASGPPPPGPGYAETQPLPAAPTAAPATVVPEVAPSTAAPLPTDPPPPPS